VSTTCNTPGFFIYSRSCLFWLHLRLRPNLPNRTSLPGLPETLRPAQGDTWSCHFDTEGRTSCPKGRNLHTPSRHAPGGLQRSADSGKPIIMRRPFTPPYNCGSGLPEQLGQPGTA